MLTSRWRASVSWDTETQSGILDLLVEAGSETLVQQVCDEAVHIAERVLIELYGFGGPAPRLAVERPRIAYRLDDPAVLENRMVALRQNRHAAPEVAP